MKQCDNGHYYDEWSYESCPYCRDSAGIGKTVAASPSYAAPAEAENAGQKEFFLKTLWKKSPAAVCSVGAGIIAVIAAAIIIPVSLSSSHKDIQTGGGGSLNPPSVTVNTDISVTAPLVTTSASETTQTEPEITEPPEPEIKLFDFKGDYGDSTVSLPESYKRNDDTYYPTFCDKDAGSEFRVMYAEYLYTCPIYTLSDAEKYADIFVPSIVGAIYGKSYQSSGYKGEYRTVGGEKAYRIDCEANSAEKYAVCKYVNG